MTFEEALIFCSVTIGAVTIMTWLVLRPFERARRAAQDADKQAAE